MEACEDECDHRYPPIPGTNVNTQRQDCINSCLNLGDKNIPLILSIVITLFIIGCILLLIFIYKSKNTKIHDSYNFGKYY